MASTEPEPASRGEPASPRTLLRSRRYLALLLFAAILGVPVAAAAYGFLVVVGYLQREIFVGLPAALGMRPVPWWWLLIPLAVAGVLVALTIEYLPGRGGHSPADGFRMSGPPSPRELPGVVLAALATLSAGVVLGPEAPLIALGGGLAAAALRVTRRNAPAKTTTVVGAAGSFASISTLLGSPLTGAFLLMEASGLGGATLDLVLIPGLLASGIGSLIFVGLGSWTGLGTFSLSLANIPRFVRPDFVEFGWAIVIGVAAACVGAGIRWLALLVRAQVRPRRLVMTPVIGLVVGGLAIGYAQATQHNVSDVLFSGQNELGGLVADGAGYSVAALLLLFGCKGLAYGVSLSCFRGGPIFPAMFLGAAGGIALSHLPGLPMVAGVAMGIGAMCVVMLQLPLTSVLLATLLLYSAGLALTPLVIVAVTVAYVVAARIVPMSDTAPDGGAADRAAPDTPS